MAILSEQAIKARNIIKDSIKIDKLIKLGNNRERAKEIIKEAENSSNSDYIYKYYGIN